MQTPRYVSRFESLFYVPSFTQKDFHYVHTGPSTKGPSSRNYNSTLGVHYSSLKYNWLYTRGTRHKVKPQSPLHKKDKAQIQTTISITSTQEEQGTKSNHNHLYTRWIRHKAKHNHLYTKGIGTKPKHNHLYIRG